MGARGGELRSDPAAAGRVARTAARAVEATGEVATAARTIDIAAGRLEAGTVAAQRMVVTGRRGGAAARFRANWYCTTELEPAWELRETGWRIRVDGDAPLDVDLRFDVPLERMGSVARLHRQPGGERGGRGVRGGTGDPHHRGPAAGDRHARGRMNPVLAYWRRRAQEVQRP